MLAPTASSQRANVSGHQVSCCSGTCSCASEGRLPQPMVQAAASALGSISGPPTVLGHRPSLVRMGCCCEHSCDDVQGPGACWARWAHWHLQVVGRVWIRAYNVPGHAAHAGTCRWSQSSATMLLSAQLCGSADVQGPGARWACWARWHLQMVAVLYQAAHAVFELILDLRAEAGAGAVPLLGRPPWPSACSGNAHMSHAPCRPHCIRWLCRCPCCALWAHWQPAEATGLLQRGVSHPEPRPHGAARLTSSLLCLPASHPCGHIRQPSHKLDPGP